MKDKKEDIKIDDKMVPVDENRYVEPDKEKDEPMMDEENENNKRVQERMKKEKVTDKK